MLKYKIPADIYSFAVTMYEVFGWKEAYTSSNFKYAWIIVEFVIEGKRLKKPDDMLDSQYNLIQQCWYDNPNQRLNIEDIISILETESLSLKLEQFVD